MLELGTLAQGDLLIRNPRTVERLGPTAGQGTQPEDAAIPGFHLDDGRFISVPIGFYATLSLATPEERARFQINGSSVLWPDLDANIGAGGLLAGAGENPYYARKSVESAVRMGRLPASAFESSAPAGLRSALPKDCG